MPSDSAPSVFRIFDPYPIPLSHAARRAEWRTIWAIRAGDDSIATVWERDDSFVSLVADDSADASMSVAEEGVRQWREDCELAGAHPATAAVCLREPLNGTRQLATSASPVQRL